MPPVEHLSQLLNPSELGRLLLLTSEMEPQMPESASFHVSAMGCMLVCME